MSLSNVVLEGQIHVADGLVTIVISYGIVGCKRKLRLFLLL